ncbi:transglutaminase family protein [Pinisolibacter aquiterrae]|uniref:transglutaminase family protein n=1 Tax=Pinisolibacter aquiterrae TaxID=2815579 RepID=UPI001C3DA519|nr:transglutaminase family protein [Pinisolibacter aquiterrae]MBV5264684.1 transglutaminase family protein [Pinisolibacter aquiterrae]MCC8233453.1 transglutaminase family protein [Pinisolibacter aquiterrae]
MRFDVTHLTVYDWGAPAPVADCRLRLSPIERRRQKVHLSRLAFDPEPDHVVDEVDWFGNHVTRIAFRAPHSRLTLRSTATVTVEPMPALDPRLSPPWEEIAAHAALSRSLAPDDPVQFVFPSRLVGLTPAVTRWTAEVFPPGRPILEAVLALNTRIHAEFRYAPGVTDVATPLARVFEEKRGVCQDFAHVMIAGLRGLGLPAAYVGGYLRTLPPPGRPRLEGADAMHAWVEVWCGPSLGWIGFDPTNAILASDDHIVVAFGRDYADTAPVIGILSSSGEQGLAVSVDVVEVPAPITGLAGAEFAAPPA